MWLTRMLCFCADMRKTDELGQLCLDLERVFRGSRFCSFHLLGKKQPVTIYTEALNIPYLHSL